MCNLLYKFKEWFFYLEASESSDAKKQAIFSIKHNFIDPYIKRILDYANAHSIDKPHFLDDQQKNYLQSVLADPGTLDRDSVIRQLFPTTQTLPNYSLASDKAIEDEIKKRESEFPLDQFGTLAEIVVKLKDKQLGDKRFTNYSTNVADLVRYTTVMAVLKEIRRGGKEQTAPETEGGAPTVDKSVNPEKLAIEEEKKEHKIMTVDKFITCMRQIYKTYANISLREIGKNLQKINNMKNGIFQDTDADGSPSKYTYKILNDLRYDGLSYFVLKFLQEQNKSGDFIFSTPELQNWLAKKYGLVNRIVQEPEFQKFLTSEIKANVVPEAVQALFLGNFLTAFEISVENAINQGGGDALRKVMSAYENTSFAKGNPDIVKLMQNIKDAKLEGNLGSTHRALKKLDLMPQSADPSEIERSISEKMLDVTYPYPGQSHLRFPQVLDYVTRLRKRPKQQPGESLGSFLRREEKHFTIGVDTNGNPIILYDDDECEDVLKKIEAAAAS